MRRLKRDLNADPSTMESKKRPLTTNNNTFNAKKARITASFQPEELCDLGVVMLSDSGDDDSETTSIYNDYDRRAAEEYEETRKSTPLPEAETTYKRKSTEDLMKIDPFGALPDEVVMGILRYLDKKSLVALSLTCHRFDLLCHDEALWPRLNLTSRKLEVDNIGHILIIGVRVLRLNSVTFPSPILSPSLSLKLENFVAKVKYLDLSYAWIKVDDLALLMNKMRYLRKLSLESVNVNLEVIKAIVINQDLDTLNLAMTTGLNHMSLSLLVKNLSKLESLNLAWTGLEACAYPTLCNQLSPSIKHLDISGSHLALKNTELVSLVVRCCNLESLDISDCLSVSLGTLREIVKNLSNLKVLGIARCYQLEVHALMELQNATKLETLSAYRLIPDNQLGEMRAAFPSVRINKNPLSVIARPTVGIRRTSIWEQPTTD